MKNCPNCGSSAQVRLIESDVIGVEDNVATIRKKYVCGCGEHFTTVQIFKAIDCDPESVIDSWNENEEE